MPTAAPPETRDETPAAPRAGAVQEVQPPVIYLRNKDDSLLQAVLGFTLEDFERLLALRAQQGLGQKPPSFRIEQIAATGVAGPDHAELSVQFIIRSDETTWVRVPLELGGAVLRDKVTYEGSGQHFVEFDDKTKKYVAWVRGSGEQPHRLTLNALAPLAALAGQTELKVGFPAATSSELKLVVPAAKAEAQVSPPAMVKQSAAKGDGTEFSIVGLTEKFSIAWRESNGRVSEVPAVLEAQGTATATIDGHSLRVRTDLSVQSFGGQFSSFRLRLPPGATLLAGNQAEYRVDDEDAPPGAPDVGRVVLVQLTEPTLGPKTLNVVTEQPHVVEQSEQSVRMATPEVLGAVRQSGVIAVRVLGDWHVAWGELRQSRQVDDLPAELRADDVVAGFEYFGQPHAIEARIFPRECHRTVEPRHVVQVDHAQLRLESRLKYRIRGAKAFGLEIDMAGWQVEDVGPRNLLEVDRAVIQDGRPLWIPLVQPTTGEIEVVLRAQRPLAGDAAKLEFELPRPKAESLASAELAIAPADNVELTPLESNIQGLVRQRSSAGLALPPRQKPALYYRGDGPTLRFVSELRIQSRTIWSDVVNRVALHERGGDVEQTLNFKIGNEPVDRLLVSVPRSLGEGGRFETSIDGKPVTPVLVTEDAANAGRNLRMSIPLQEKRLGDCQLVVRHALPAEAMSPATGKKIAVPLVMPAEGELGTNTAHVTVAPGMTSQLQDELWSESPGAVAASRGASQLTATVPTDELSLVVTLSESSAKDVVVVERVWVQTWLNHSERQDRAVFQFTSRQRRLGIRLPLEAAPAQTRVFLDGQPIAIPDGAADQLWIDLPGGDNAPKSHVVDLLYRFPSKPRASGRLALDLPRLADAAWVRHTQWQLVLPDDEHVLVGPKNLNDEFTWTRWGLGWGRVPLRDQAELETWTNASHDGSLPSSGNRYLFSTLGSIDSVQLHTTSRAALVLVTSGVALAVGLLVLYVPAARRPPAMFAAAVAFAAFCFAAPDVALLVVQAAALGLMLAGLAYVMRRLLVRRRPAVLVRGTSSSIIDLGSTQSQMPAQGSEVWARSDSTETQLSSSEGAT